MPGVPAWIGSIYAAAWRWSPGPARAFIPSVPAIELAARGAIGMIVWCPPGGAWFQAPDALGAFDAQWPSSGPPMVFVSTRDGETLRDAVRGGSATVTMTLDVEVSRSAVGHNVVGFLPGDEPGPVVVGAHHDAWFQGAFDNTSGVAVLLTLAKAMVDAGHRPRHTICFTSRTGEEFGLLHAQHDWCVGAWHQIASTHREWGERSPFHLCLEASGRPGLRTIVEAPVEYRAWAREVCRVAAAQGWTPTGWRVAPPVTGTEQWPYLVQGVPGVAAYSWETSFADTEYHTQLDTPATVDAEIAAAQARLYALLLIDADRRPDEILDHRPRARELARIAERSQHDTLAEAAERHRTAAGRSRFGVVGRELHAVDADGAACYPHRQTAHDVDALRAALAALDSGDRVGAARQLRKVGSNRLHPFLSETSLQTYLDQFTGAAVEGSWGSACHLTQSPNLWNEIATVQAGGDARLALERALGTAEGDCAARLDAMAAALTVPIPVAPTQENGSA